MVREDVSEKVGFELRIDTEGGGRKPCGCQAGGLPAVGALYAQVCGEAA